MMKRAPVDSIDAMLAVMLRERERVCDALANTVLTGGSNRLKLTARLVSVCEAIGYVKAAALSDASETTPK